ncbi:hypothetical protein C1645_831329 [Glomus cerebriforme]|uniref:Uncharacterized protein n=1 Tax=Glomus cerebriforme TaxID=658196 RepID=A0A397SJK8_9GLOM|nr:hypothetical protein C1645_831329 [Glomus cerebriforme]
MTHSNTPKKSLQERDRKNNFQKLDMYNKSVAKNKCQYVEIDYNQGLDDTKKSNKSSSLSKKLISNKLNTQKFYEEYGIADPSSRMSQEPVITSSDKNKKDKKKANKKKAKNKK